MSSGNRDNDDVEHAENAENDENDKYYNSDYVEDLIEKIEQKILNDFNDHIISNNCSIFVILKLVNPITITLSEKQYKVTNIQVDVPDPSNPNILFSTLRNGSWPLKRHTCITEKVCYNGNYEEFVNMLKELIYNKSVSLCNC